ncbi:uncharacterized protein PEZ65_010116 [Lycodopsis pacificus]
MIEEEVVLEALRVLCSEGLTSAQSQGFNVRSSPAEVCATGATGAAQQHLLHITDLTHLALCGAAAWTSESWGTRFLGGLKSFVDLPNDIKRDPKTGTTTLVPKDLVWSKKHLDPGFNYDFSNLKDTEKYSRGGEEYKRPYGWQRFGLKVLDEYEDNTWLGNMNRETESASGEWPVSYHGTKDPERSVKGIIEDHYKPGDRDKHGRGIYSTPDIKIASEDYAREFSSKGDKYKVIMQNRINPKYRVICPEKDYWLVRVEDDANARAIVQRAIRPYGLLLRKV